LTMSGVPITYDRQTESYAVPATYRFPRLDQLPRAGKINHSRIVGGRIRYTADDLLAYLRHHHEAGTGKGR
jgi:hypothetical protein